MIKTFDLSGKYFIQGVLIPAINSPVVRGRILGPVQHEMAPYYLCELHAADASKLAIRSQCIYGIDVFASPNVYLYGDREIWELEWQSLWRRLEQLTQASRPSAQSYGQQLAAVLKKMGVEQVEILGGVDDMDTPPEPPKRRRRAQPPRE